MKPNFHAFSIVASLVLGLAQAVSPDPKPQNFVIGRLSGATNEINIDVPAITLTRTNHVDQILAVISSMPKGGLCPECGGPNHHQVQVLYMAGFDQIYGTITYQGHTNTALVATGPMTNWLSTNTVLANYPTQPGAWRPPPLPPTTNR